MGDIKIKPSVLKIDSDYASEHIPPRIREGNKGSFGRALIIAGSMQYIGAAHLCIEAALRGGAGYVELVSESAVCDSALLKFPEVIYTRVSPYSDFIKEDIERVKQRAKSASSVLIGPGCSKSAALANVVAALIKEEGAPLIIDADAINSLAEYSEDPIELLVSAKRKTVLTPHPLEFSRLTGKSLGDIASSRVDSALSLSSESGAAVLLKGYETVVASGGRVMINTTGSSALAKAGSGDTLAGMIASLIAMGGESSDMAAIGAFVHGKAGDILASELSEYGVTPSDLPRAMAQVIAELTAICKK